MPINPKTRTTWIKCFLLGSMVACANSALAHVPAPLFATSQDQLFREAYRLAIPANLIVYPWMSSIVDYDNDGSLDVILYGHHSSDAYIWRGARAAAEYLPKGSWVFGVRDPIWLDADNDGDIDGIGTEGTNISNELFLNQGDGNFVRSSQPYWIPANDLKDIAQFLPMPSHIPPSKHPLDAKLTKANYVDLNSDGSPELVASFTGRITFQEASGPATRYSGYSWVLEQRDGVWIDVTESLGLREGLEQIFFPEDVDMDGDLDIVDLLAENIYLNDGYRFTKVNTAPIFGGRRPYDGDGEIDLIDLDNNGYRDFIFGNDHTSANGTYLNTGNLTFQKLEGTIVRPSRRERKFADLDSDGDIDMVAYNGKEMIVYDNVTPNRGIYVTFEGDYFGTRLQVTDSSNNLVLNAQLFQYQNRGMSQVYINSVHVGGITGPVQAFASRQSSVSYVSGHIVDPQATSFLNGILHIAQVEVDGAIFSVNMRYTDPATDGFSLTDATYVATLDQKDVETALYADGVLTLPVVRVAGNKKFEARLDFVEGTSPMKFVLVSATEIP